MKKISKMILISAVLSVAFSLSVIAVSAAVDESEPNDTRSTADVIQMGTTIYGDTSTITTHGYVDYDEDWFKFTAPISGTAKVVLTADDFTQEESDGVDLAVYDSNKNRMFYIFDGCDTSGSENHTFPVSAGKTYYINVYGSDGVIGIYRNASYHFNVGYSIGKTSISKVTPKDNAFNVKWNRKTKASFYQIRYTKKSTYQDYGWTKAKKIKVEKEYGNKTIKKLANKKYYYVQVRVARTIKGVTYYSGWSTRKSVKTK